MARSAAEFRCEGAATFSLFGDHSVEAVCRGRARPRCEVHLVNKEAGTILPIPK
jgi:hypothetical protein